MQNGYLLDTHIIIWLLTQPEKLSTTVRHIILDNDNTLYFSMISLWEITIKISLGKLKLSDNWQLVFQAELKANYIEPLQLDWPAFQIIEKLPFHHQDPFDRVLIAQALSRQLSFISANQSCNAYDIAIIS